MSIHNRLEKLRKLMKDRNIDAYIIPTSDPHQSEYISDYYKTREYISGFTGSAGTAVVTMDKAGLWTDARYFLQAEKELANTEFHLYKMGIEGEMSLEEFLLEEVREFGKIGFDGNCFSVSDYKNLSEKMGSRALVYDIDYISQIWADRPDLPKNPVWIFDEKYVGESFESKLKRLRDKMDDLGCDYTFIGAPEDICYLLNIRGGDVEYTPVVLSYLLVSHESVHLCIDRDKLTSDVLKYLDEKRVKIHNYSYITDLMKQIKGKNWIYLDPDRTNVNIYDSINSNVRVKLGLNITSSMKAIKNEIELENQKEAYLIDCASLVKFFNWVKIGTRTGALTELIASKKLHDIRAENETFIDDSFETIAGFAENAAIVHYAPSNLGSKTLGEKGMLLVDSGAHYKQGTTDITRTIALGKLTEEEKNDYTLVLKSFIAIMTAKFKNKTNGERLDMIARYPLWKAGKDFLHSTGHGVGYVLSVHEGPQRIGDKNQVEFVENMTTSIEPGLYIAGKHGIRIENEVYVKEDFVNEFGRFMRFENLTYLPIDTAPINIDMLDMWEIEWLNSYNKKCQELLSPYLDGSDLEYLKESCKEI
ncbi:MAG: aminopeptidase P family protein [Peptoniphilaceae bacterium]|nr:aminopeptidase P family protein [Peptoniphilaceae bacterium]MDY6019410.1 aminopeptidase P family protein [Anaerococcus sp.]